MQNYSPSKILLDWISNANNKTFIQFNNTIATYKDTLDLIAEKINLITNQGIPKGTIIGVYADNTFDNIISVLAILCSEDYIYSPIFDPEDSVYAEYAFINNNCIPFSNAGNHTLDNDMRAKLAYLAYTSGTTGSKKIVLASKSNLSSMLCVSSQSFDGLFKRHLMLFDMSFDGSLASIIWTIANSGILHITNSTTKNSPINLVNYINQHNIDTLLCLPKQYELIIDETPETLTSLKAIVTAGDIAPATLYTKHLEKTNNCKLYNAYGTTETSIWNSIYLCKDKVSQSSIPIGCPLENSSFNINCNNKNNNEGELIITGSCVCIGYLSGERFNGTYHTGDTVNISNDYYTFLHRVPAYIKRNGIRIPNVDIIQDIKQLSYVSDCDILTDDPFELIINQNDASMGEGDRHKIIQDIYKYLRRSYTQNQLPTKIHYSKPEMAGHQNKTNNNPWYRIIEKIFKEAIGSDNIDTNLSFFENGGDSLTAISLVAGINKHFNTVIAIDRIFKDSKISSILGYIHEDIDTPRSILQNLNDIASDTLMILFPPAAGMPLFYSGLANNITNNKILSIIPPLKNIHEYVSISDYSAYCIEAIKEIKDKKIILAGFSYGAYWALETCYQLEGVGFPIEKLILIDAPTVYNKNINVDEQSNEFMKFMKKNSTLSGFDNSYMDLIYNKFKALYKSQEQSLCNYNLPESLKTGLYTITSTMRSDDPLFCDESYLNQWSDIKHYNFIHDTTIDAKHETLFNPENVITLSTIMRETMEMEHEYQTK